MGVLGPSHVAVARGLRAVVGVPLVAMVFLVCASGVGAVVWAPRVLGPRTGGFSAVSCVSGRWCAAVGTRSSGFQRTAALAEVWDGAHWSVVPAASVVSARFGSELNGVSCTSRRWCIAVGSFGVKGNTDQTRR